MEQLTPKDLPSYALISAQRALLGVITPGIRAISMEWDKDYRLSFRVHYESQPTEEEAEEMDIVTAEIMADVPLFSWSNLPEIVVSTVPPNELSYLSYLIYRRKEPVTTS
jgi:hypothetical protein